MRDEPAHFASEHPIKIRRVEDKIRITIQQTDDYGNPAKIPDDKLGIVIVRFKDNKRQLFKEDKWIDIGNDRISKHGPTLQFEKGDLEELLEDLLKIMEQHNL